MSLVYENIDCLSTPCGDITVTDENDNRCRFSVEENPCKIDHYLFGESKEENLISTETNYVIMLDINDLQMGHYYKIRLESGILSYGDSDENTVTLSGISDGYSIALGSYDPNWDIKMRQAYIYSRKVKNSPHEVKDEKYDKSKFVRYFIERLADDSGYIFQPLDDSVSNIAFKTAWIENNYIDFDDYDENEEYYRNHYLFAVEDCTL